MATKRFVSKDNLGRVWARLFGKVLNSKEEIEANTSENMIAGADAVKEVYSSLKNENNESFNFGVKDGVRGYYTNPSRADDSFVPFSSGGFVFCGGNGHANILPDIWKYYTYSFTFIYCNEKVVSFANNAITFLQGGKYKLTLKYTHTIPRIYIKANLNNAELETRYFDTEAKRTWELAFNVQKGDVLSFSVQCNNRNDLGDAWYDSTMVIE